MWVVKEPCLETACPVVEHATALSTVHLITAFPLVDGGGALGAWTSFPSNHLECHLGLFIAFMILCLDLSAARAGLYLTEPASPVAFEETLAIFFWASPKRDNFVVCFSCAWGSEN